MRTLTQLQPERRLVVAMAGMTMLTGLVDATSYLGLGHVFTANMTGNVVFLGFAVGEAAGFSIVASLLALVASLSGAVIGGRLVRPDHTSRAATTVFAVQAVVLVAAVVVASTVDDPRVGVGRWSLLALLGAAMGLQNAAVRRLAVSDMTTTVLTLTLTGIAADSRFARGTDPRILRRFGSVVLMLAGAAIGAALEHQSLLWPVAAAALVSLASTVWLKMTPNRSPTTDKL